MSKPTLQTYIRPPAPGVVLVACSWCHSMNQIDDVPCWCWFCGHRAEEARADCDCPTCRKPDAGDPRRI